jgi:hypothetical protein
MHGARLFEFNLFPRSATTLFHASFPGRIHTLSMASRKFYHPQLALKLCALELHAATFTLRHPPWRFYHLKLPSCAPSSSTSSSQAVRPRAPPQALKLCALELHAIRIATLKLASCELLSSRPSHCYLRSPRQFYHPQAPNLCAPSSSTLLPSPSVTLLGDFTTSSSQAVRPRAPCCYLHPPSPPLAILPPQAPKLCALELHLKLSSCAPSSSKPSGLLPSSS